jgi:hypothetical protein
VYLPSKHVEGLRSSLASIGVDCICLRDEWLQNALCVLIKATLAVCAKTNAKKSTTKPDRLHQSSQTPLQAPNLILLQDWCIRKPENATHGSEEAHKESGW